MTRAKIVLLGLLVLFGVIFWWLFNHARLRIVVDNPSGSVVITYKLSQSGAEPNGKMAKSITKLVRRGDYGVVVQQGDRSYFGSVTIGGFLGKTTVTARLEEESARELIGNNPGNCPYLVRDILFSGVCNDPLNELDRHVPANSNAPTHTQKLTTALGDRLLSVIETKGGSHYAVTQSSSGSSVVAYSLDASGQLGNSLNVTGLPSGGDYVTHGYKDGFILLDAKTFKLFYYNPDDSSTKELALPKPSDAELAYHSLDVSGDSIMVTFSKGPVDGYTDSNPDRANQVSQNPNSNTKKSAAQVMIIQPDTVKSFKFSYAPYRIKICGPDRLCALRVGGELTVYDISGKKAHRLYSIYNVADIESTATNFTLISNTGLTIYDVRKRVGRVAYSFGDYLFEGLTTGGKDYIVTVANGAGDSYALQINPTQTNTDSVDKKISQLTTNSYVASASIYRKFIFITPQLGAPVYDPAVGSFNYPSGTRQAASQAITEQLQKLGLDGYTVINTLQ